ncbi:MAG: YkgJ family cysteine cluster protein [Pseudomonadota bacterium]
MPQPEDGTSSVLARFASLTGCSIHPTSAYEHRPWSADAETADVCAGCPAPCCTTYVVPLNVVDAYRLRSELGLEWRAFATFAPYHHDAPTWWVRLGQHKHQLALKRRKRRCLFVRRVGGQLQCSVHAQRPKACRVFPIIANRVAQRRAPPGMLAQQPPSECPRAWPSSSRARDALEQLIVDDETQRAVDREVLRIWSRQLNVKHTRTNFFAFLDEIMARRGHGDLGSGRWRTSLW